VLRLAAAVEQSSEHPLALAIVEAAKARSLVLAQVAEFDSPQGGALWAQSTASGSCSATHAS
jgi:Cu+-exporting ATPase